MEKKFDRRDDEGKTSWTGRMMRETVWQEG